MFNRSVRQSYLCRSEFQTKEDLVITYLPLIKNLAGKLSIALPASLDKSDLVGSGIIGLLEAYERYDPARGVKFSSYASLRIRGAMIDEIRKVSLAPRSFFSRLRQVQEAVKALRQSLGREPTPGEIAGQLGWLETAVERVWSNYNLLAVVSLEKLLFKEMGEDGFTVEDILSTSHDTPELALIKKERQHLLAEALNELPEREKLLLSLYYYEDLTQKEIAKLMCVSTARVSQMHARAIQRLQEMLGSRL
ncbi:MAG TPA: FliA/WhiG family RNA polymerase sigma factor [Firmicutes bacterium]|nr:FliA/WhiG family RNA polymerase sigma factor [Bacillota bacterium]